MIAPTSQIPAESRLLDAAYRRSGLTAADLAAAAGISAGSVRIALSGRRYRKDEVQVVVPPDQTLAKLAGALGISAESLRELGRERAAELVAGLVPASVPADEEAAAVIAARRAVFAQVLAVVPTEELQAEIKRRGETLEEAHRDLDRLEANEAADAEAGFTWSDSKQAELDEVRERVRRLENG